MKSLGGNFNLLPIEKSTFNKVVIPSSLELNFDSCFILWKIFHNDCKVLIVDGEIFHNDNKVLIVDGDLRLTPRIFSNTQVDIFVRGRLSISSFKNYFEPKEYDYISSEQRCYTVADKDFLYTIDLDKKKIFKSKNDGRFIY